MTFLWILIPMGYNQVPRSLGVEVVYNFFERSTVPEVESSINPHANIFGVSYKAYEVQNNRLKTNRLLSIPFPVSYTIKLHREVQDKRLPTRMPYCWMVKQTSFPILLATYHPCQSLHIGVCHNFGATNPDRCQSVRCWRP